LLPDFKRQDKFKVNCIRPIVDIQPKKRYVPHIRRREARAVGHRSVRLGRGVGGVHGEQQRLSVLRRLRRRHLARDDVVSGKLRCVNSGSNGLWLSLLTSDA